LLNAFARSYERDRPHRLSGRIGVFVFGLLAYLSFFGVFVYAIGFVGNWIVPKSIDSGAPSPMWTALLINGALLLVFVIQHTIMARPAFKRWWTRIVPASVERSIYVLAASASLALLFWLWRPLPQEVWHFRHPIALYGLSALSLVGYAIVFTASCMVSHFDLFGLRQVTLRLLDKPYKPVGFRLVGLYHLVRHPLMVGFLIAFWSTPVMSVGHLFFAIMTTGYILFGTWIEERDLVAEHGESYLAYRRRVRGLLPIPRHNASAKENKPCPAHAQS
jgi:protein-S-isoprenylcysteine O-methyltransferase Ste14